jgi:hypothetical protein
MRSELWGALGDPRPLTKTSQSGNRHELRLERERARTTFCGTVIALVAR